MSTHHPGLHLFISLAAIDVVVKATNSNKTYKYTLNPGQRQVITLPFGGYTIDATVNGLTLASETIGLPDQSVTLMFAVEKPEINR